MQRTASILAICAALFGACSTDLEINDEYKNITVVEGLLDMRDSLQLIKVNKGFLGNGDALTYAQIQDSNEWNGDAIEYAHVVRRRNGQTMGTFPLHDTIITDRNTGTFYAPTQKMYYFNDASYRTVEMVGGVATPLYLDKASEYVLEVKVKGEVITATTNIVNDFPFQAADQSTEQVINLLLGSQFNRFELNWDSGVNGRRYVADYSFTYQEMRNGELGEVKRLTQRMATVVKRGTVGNEAMSASIDGRDFYQNLAAAIADDPTVQRRVFLGVEFTVSVANDEFHTFLTLSEPVSGIIEDRPSYSNVTNGYGIFASRYVKQIRGKRLGPTSLAQLATGDITGHLRFCSGLQGDVLSPHYCP